MPTLWEHLCFLIHTTIPVVIFRLEEVWRSYTKFVYGRATFDDCRNTRRSSGEGAGHHRPLCRGKERGGKLIIVALVLGLSYWSCIGEDVHGVGENTVALRGMEENSEEVLFVLAIQHRHVCRRGYIYFKDNSIFCDRIDTIFSRIFEVEFYF